MVSTTAKGLLGSSQCPVLEIRSNVLRHLSMFISSKRMTWTFFFPSRLLGIFGLVDTVLLYFMG